MHERIKPDARRQIPAVGQILDALSRCDLPRPVVVNVIRQELSQVRAATSVPDLRSIVDTVNRSLDELRTTRLQPIVNGTGVLIHTNFGRAPLAAQAVRSLNEIASGYSNLEYDLATGERGGRGGYIEHALALLCGAEAATTVNNCAAALVSIVHFATQRRRSDAQHRTEVIVSRGELVQIGGGFRIGEIIEASGAQLREVGATNKTALDDYARAIGSKTAMILKVHRSNFFMSGFVESPSTTEISGLARKNRVSFVSDLGSGAVVATGRFGIVDHEPTPAETLKNGADLVCFSGDKLFGGPQAGIIAGKKRLIRALKREPLHRALRCDKLCLAALQATIDLHLIGEISEIPTLGLLQTAEDELRKRAMRICRRLSRECSGLQIAIGRSKAKTGGGTLPKSNIPSVTIDVVPLNSSLAEFSATLRASNPPIVGYAANHQFKLDLRTILPQQDEMVVEAICKTCAK